MEEKKELMAQAANLFYQREELQENLRRIQIALVDITGKIKALNESEKPVDKKD